MATRVVRTWPVAAVTLSVQRQPGASTVTVPPAAGEVSEPVWSNSHRAAVAETVTPEGTSGRGFGGDVAAALGADDVGRRGRRRAGTQDNRRGRAFRDRLPPGEFHRERQSAREPVGGGDGNGVVAESAERYPGEQPKDRHHRGQL